MFNVQLIGFDKNKFIGLPTPIASVTLVSYILFYHDKIFSEAVSNIIISILVIVLAILMVSKLRYDTMPKFSIQSFKKNPFIFSVLFIGLALVIITRGEALFFVCLFYLCSGIYRSIEHYISKKFKKVGGEQEDEEVFKLNDTKLNS